MEVLIYLGGIVSGLVVGFIVSPMLGKYQWTKLTAEELSAQIAKHGLQYDHTVASTKSLAAHLDSKGVQERFMGRLIEHVRTRPMTSSQYRMLAEVACAAEQDYWARLKKRGCKDSSA